LLGSFKSFVYFFQAGLSQRTPAKQLQSVLKHRTFNVEHRMKKGAALRKHSKFDVGNNDRVYLKK
jgi:hypothetical protein